MRIALAAIYLGLTAQTASAADTQSRDWGVVVREALPPEVSGQNVWLGLRNNTARPSAVCVASVSSGGDAAVLLGTLGTCTNTQSFHLVLPGESFYFMTSAPPASSGDTLRFSVNISVWPLGRDVPASGWGSTKVEGTWRKP